MKFVILSDLHVGPEGYYNEILRKINKNVKGMLVNFVESVNNDIKPDFVIFMGDFVEDDNHENDVKNLKFITKTLSKVDCKVYYVVGNHDLKNISENEIINLLGLNRPYYSFDFNGVHFIVLFSRKLKGEGTVISKDQINWLKEDISNTKNKCVVFVHHGLADQNLKGNPWFEGRPSACLIKNRREVRRILKNSNKVIAAFNGHLHWDKKHVHDSIPYFTIQSIVENEDNKNIPSEAYALVNIEKNKIVVNIKGNYPKKFEHKL